MLRRDSKILATANIKRIDRVAKPEEGGTTFGAALTVVVFGLWVAYLCMLVIAYVGQPLPAVKEVRWTRFKRDVLNIELACRTGTCSIAHRYSGRSELSQRCATAVAQAGFDTSACGVALPPKATRVTALCYSDLPHDGLLVRWSSGDVFGADVLSVMEEVRARSSSSAPRASP